MRSSDPTPAVRARTYERDVERCVSCGRPVEEYQHRASVGQGGSKVRPHLPDGLASCSVCNNRYEGDRQIEALLNGWKVRRWVFQQNRCDEVPVLYMPERSWFRLTFSGLRLPVSRPAAYRMMHEVYGPEYDEWLGLVAA